MWSEKEVKAFKTVYNNIDYLISDIVIEDDVTLTFKITNNDYNVFEVNSIGMFFAGVFATTFWLNFLKDLEQVRRIILDLTYYE